MNDQAEGLEALRARVVEEIEDAQGTTYLKDHGPDHPRVIQSRNDSADAIMEAVEEHVTARERAAWERGYKAAAHQVGLARARGCFTITPCTGSSDMVP